MTGKDPTFVDELRALSSHPSLEELAAFHEGRLAPEEMERIRNHIESCADCSEQSIEVKRFLSPGEPPLDEAAVGTIWRNLSESLGFEQEPAVKVPTTPRPPVTLRPPSRVFQKLAAGLLVAATVASTGAWFASEQQVARLEEGEVNVSLVAIDKAVRRGIEQGKEPQPVAVPPGAVLVLTPLRAPGDAAHQILLSNADGETVWSEQGLRPINGNFQIKLPRDLEPGGIYHLRITPGEGQDFTLRVTGPGPE